MLKKILAGLMVTLTMSAAQPTLADEGSSYVLKRIKERGVINMGHRESSVPFSYIGSDGEPIGYHVDICHAFVEQIKSALRMPNLKVKYVPVTAQTRIPLIANGTLDMECGSTTNNLTRSKQVDYLAVTFITGTKLGHKKGSGIKELEDMQGKVIALALGTTNEKSIKRVMKAKGLDIKIVPVKDHPQAWLAVETGRADAYATDDVLLFGLMSKSKDPSKYQVTGRFLSYDPYGIMIPRNDSTYRLIGNRMLADMMRSGELHEIYKKWFDPGATDIQMPMSSALKTAFEIQALPH